MLSVNVMEQLGFKYNSNDEAGGANADMSLINDFTLIDFQYLVVLMKQGRFVVFDCSMVLEGSARQLRYVNQDQIRPTEAILASVDDAIMVDTSEAGSKK